MMSDECWALREHVRAHLNVLKLFLNLLHSLCSTLIGVQWQSTHVHNWKNAAIGWAWGIEQRVIVGSNMFTSAIAPSSCWEYFGYLYCFGEIWAWLLKYGQNWVLPYNWNHAGERLELGRGQGRGVEGWCFFGGGIYSYIQSQHKQNTTFELMWSGWMDWTWSSKSTLWCW